MKKQNKCNRFISNILNGMASVLVLDTGRDYQKPDRTGFYQDAKNLSNDAQQVARDLNKTISHYGQINCR
jgi:hypothetical protein